MSRSMNLIIRVYHVLLVQIHVAHCIRPCYDYFAKHINLKAATICFILTAVDQRWHCSVQKSLSRDAPIAVFSAGSNLLLTIFQF